ncbi:uncharacterized protein Obp8a [Drosophila virilis]|uniref:Odorant-binding protein 8a n=1 Tax=Drosophila virilis TaxID=7244 RepID=B4M3S7_DROVI|nr:uncharacterized protein LOC6632113 [Drosophila virilis]EDW65452.2 Odorant-binding protein 8a [Drosophila virilis]
MPDLCVNIKQMTSGSCDCQSNPIQSNPNRSETIQFDYCLPPTGYGSGFIYVRYVPNAKWLTSFLLHSSGLLAKGWGQLQWISTLLFMMLILDKRNQQFTDAVCPYPHAAQSGSIGGPKMTIIRVLILLSVLFTALTRDSLLLALPTSTTSSARSAQSLAILRARDECYRSERIGPDQRLALERQLYRNLPYVHRYVYCFWTRLQLWQDGMGFDAMRIVESFGGPRRLNLEQTVPAINSCNAHARRSTRTVLDWCYGAFVCVLGTPVGDWYRRHMQDVINGNA